MRTRITVLIGLIVGSLAALVPADDKAPMPKAEAPAVKVELHRLDNDALLKQATDLYDKAAKEYRATVRGLAAAEIQLSEAERKPDEKAPEETKEEDKAKAAVEAAKLNAEAARKALLRVQARKAALDRVAAAGEAAQSAGTAFLNALEDLKPYLVEIDLRVKDGSLEPARRGALVDEALEKNRKSIAADQERRRQRGADAQKDQGAVAKALEAANKSSLAAEAQVAQAGKALVQEQKRQEMEKSYAGKKSAALLADMTRLVEEGSGLKGTYELALSRFNTRSAEAGKRRKTLEGLKPPDAKVPPIARAEDVEVAARAIEQLIAFHAARAKAIRGLRTALLAVVKQAGEFEADAAVSSDHLFRMSVIAGLLAKAGTPDDQLPDGGQPKRVAAAAERQAKSAADVLVAAEKGKAELAALDKQLAEVEQAEAAAAKQLEGLKQSRESITAALQWEGQLRTKTAAEVIELFASSRKELDGKLVALKKAAEEYRQAGAEAAEVRSRLQALKDPLLRQAEEQGQGERLKILGELRKEAGLDRAAAKDAPAPPPAEPKKADKDDKKAEPEKKAEPDKRTPIEKAADTLAAFQQQLAARGRVSDERREKTKELLTALEALEKKTAAYLAALGDARRLCLRLSAAGTDLKKRVGRGQLEADKIPDGVTEALRGKLQTQLDADSAAALTARAQAELEREALRRADPDGDALLAATRELLALIDGRLDRLDDLKKLAADYQRDKKDRPASEALRTDQLAADRKSDDTSTAETLLAIDSSTAAKGLEDLLQAYYRELVEIKEKDENLTKQKEKVEELIELARKESDAVARVLPLLEKQAAKLRVAQEEAFVLARASLKPDQADELLEAYQTKTGRLLARPAPVGDKEKAEEVNNLAAALFERLARTEAYRRWGEVLAVRLTPAGAKADAGVYQDELVRVNALAAANARRVTALTGEESSAGEIGKVRRDLMRVRSAGVKTIALKLGGILVAALLLPWLFVWVLRRITGNGEAGLVLTALRAFVKVGVWVGVLALALSVLGFDVTAILAGLGIGGLAIGLAAQSLISDVIAAVVIFAERRFKVGDVIKIDALPEPGRVVGLNWRSTQLRDTNGIVVNVPNQKVLQCNIQNLTKAGRTFDSLTVKVTTAGDVEAVLAAIRDAVQDGPLTEHGAAVQRFTRRGDRKVVKYELWWYLDDVENRKQIRDEMFARIAAAVGESPETKVVMA